MHLRFVVEDENMDELIYCIALCFWMHLILHIPIFSLCQPSYERGLSLTHGFNNFSCYAVEHMLVGVWDHFNSGGTASGVRFIFSQCQRGGEGWQSTQDNLEGPDTGGCVIRPLSGAPGQIAQTSVFIKKVALWADGH